MVRSFSRQALPIVAAVFVACCLAQVFLAGLGVFDDPRSFLTHREFGYLIGWFTLVLLILALLGREPKQIVGLTVLLMVQFALQSAFVAMRVDYPTVAALHPVNGFLILAVGALVARLSWALRREGAAQAARPPETSAPSPSPAAASTIDQRA